MTAPAHSIETLAARRRRRTSRHRLTLGILAGLVFALFTLTMVLGQSYTPLTTVIRVLMGENVEGASFLIGTLRLPRALVSVLAGLCFGLGGVVFQIMLRNPLASPDFIGITWGASAAAVFSIVVLSLSGPPVSIVAVVAGLLAALLVYGLAARNGVAGARFILVGIGISAMLRSVTSYILASAPAWSLQDALRWLTGSVNGAQISDVLPLLLAFTLFGGLLFTQRRDLEALRMGDDTAAALGVKVARTRILLIIAAVGLIGSATAITGPIAFVSFLAGPIAARIVGGGGSVLIPAALVGAALVLASDYTGQFLLPTRYPVGVISGVLGAPYLLYLIVRINRKGRSL
ncbi:ABC transporter permease [Agaricicola taiwanensis]|uniref:ABC transporter permease n=1 Tax=Agaricicola taiwanensis TaxID=591372 RepID=A0A8J3DZY7_9RHOB|nr:iron ABC transporter permease [Agaricicola taiwanensis]GGE49567.1 ABC transporter permease [Agaricicola taiwanensis]